MNRTTMGPLDKVANHSSIIESTLLEIDNEETEYWVGTVLMIIYIIIFRITDKLL